MEKAPMMVDKAQGFMLGLIGKPGSGKTFLIKYLISEVFKDKFSYMLLCSPSNIEYKDYIPESQSYSSFDIGWIYKMINMINLSQQQSKNKNVVIIIDDCIAEVKDKIKDSKIASLFFNRRHLLWGNGIISIVLTSQKYTMVPARFRSCLTNIILFSLSPFDMQKIFEESIVKFTKAQWAEIIGKVYEKEHNYLEIDIDKQLISYSI